MTRGVLRQFNVVGSAATLASQTEQVLATLAGVSTDGGAQFVLLTAIVPLTPNNADVTGVRLRIRRASLTGTIVESLTPDVQLVTASAGGDVLVVMGRDYPGEVANMSYVLTGETLAGAGTCAIAAPVMSANVQ